MPQALPAYFPLTGGGGLVIYHPSPVERYFSVAPGIEVSIDPYKESRWKKKKTGEELTHDRRRRLNLSKNKGMILDTNL